MRIDILVSVLSEGKSELEIAMEEQNLKNSIGKLLSERGYEKFTIAGSELIRDDVKENGQIVLNDEEEARPHYKRCELDANYEFSEETIKDLYEYLLSIASESWKEFTPKEADSIGADYDSYWDRDHEDEGNLSLNRNYSIYIEAPYQKTNKDNMVRLYKFNKRKFESFVYDLGKIVG